MVNFIRMPLRNVITDTNFSKKYSQTASNFLNTILSFEIKRPISNDKMVFEKNAANFSDFLFSVEKLAVFLWLESKYRVVCRRTGTVRGLLIGT